MGFDCCYHRNNSGDNILSLRNFYKDTCDIYRLTTTTGSWGGSVEQYADTTVDVTGYLQPISGSEAYQNAKIDEVYTHRFYCPSTTSVNVSDYLKFSSGYYRVTFSQANGITNQGKHAEILLAYTGNQAPKVTA